MIKLSKSVKSSFYKIQIKPSFQATHPSPPEVPLESHPHGMRYFPLLSLAEVKMATLIIVGAKIKASKNTSICPSLIYLWFAYQHPSTGTVHPFSTPGKIKVSLVFAYLFLISLFNTFNKHIFDKFIAASQGLGVSSPSLPDWDSWCFASKNLHDLFGNKATVSKYQILLMRRPERHWQASSLGIIKPHLQNEWSIAHGSPIFSCLKVSLARHWCAFGTNHHSFAHVHSKFLRIQLATLQIALESDRFESLHQRTLQPPATLPFALHDSQC